MSAHLQAHDERSEPTAISRGPHAVFTLVLLAALIGFGVGVASGISHGTSPLELTIDALLLAGALGVGFSVALLTGKTDMAHAPGGAPQKHDDGKTQPVPSNTDGTRGESEADDGSSCEKGDPSEEAKSSKPSARASSADDDPVEAEPSSSAKNARREAVDPSPPRTRNEILRISDDFHRIVQLELSSLGLTRQEQSIAELIIRGNRYSDIAKRLYLSVSTVKYHSHAIFTKAHVSTKREFQDLMRTRIMRRS